MFVFKMTYNQKKDCFAYEKNIKQNKMTFEKEGMGN